jgi:hypothetical protein
VDGLRGIVVTLKNARRRPTGYLNLLTDPWATIYHGRRRLGNTPLVRVKLPTGRVKLRAVNRVAGIDRAFHVEIRRGRVTRRSLRLTRR